MRLKDIFRHPATNVKECKNHGCKTLGATAFQELRKCVVRLEKTNRGRSLPPFVLVLTMSMPSRGMVLKKEGIALWKLMTCYPKFPSQCTWWAKIELTLVLSNQCSLLVSWRNSLSSWCRRNYHTRTKSSESCGVDVFSCFSGSILLFKTHPFSTVASFGIDARVPFVLHRVLGRTQQTELRACPHKHFLGASRGRRFDMHAGVPGWSTLADCFSAGAWRVFRLILKDNLNPWHVVGRGWRGSKTWSECTTTKQVVSLNPWGSEARATLCELVKRDTVLDGVRLLVRAGCPVFSLSTYVMVIRPSVCVRAQELSWHRVLRCVWRYHMWRGTETTF